MKIWLLDDDMREMARVLDTQRLVAQHHEWHYIWRQVTEVSHRWCGWERPQYRHALWDVHQHIVEELRLRGLPSGLDHQTVVDEPTPKACAYMEQMAYPILPNKLQVERWTLVCRLAGTFKGRGDVPLWFTVMALRYNAQGQCLHDGNVEQVGATIQLCLLCKQFVRRNIDGLWFPKKGFI